MKIGDYDESDPNGTGYKIMTREGLKTFDLSEHDDYLRERTRVSDLLSAAGNRSKRPHDPTKQCRRCERVCKTCFPPSVGPCTGFSRHNKPWRFKRLHYA